MDWLQEAFYIFGIVGVITVIRSLVVIEEKLDAIREAISNAD